MTKTKEPLLDLLKPPPTYDLIIEPIPFKVALFEDAYRIVSIRKSGDEIVARYQIPGQWSAKEVAILIQQIRGLSWQLLEDESFEGRPCHNDEIQQVCEDFCREFGGYINT